MGDSIVELETDKVNIEVPSPSSGMLEKITVEEGQTVNVGLNGGVETIWAPHGTAGSELWSTINTAGFIYFVRDPRSVAISLSYHMNQSLEHTRNLSGLIKLIPNIYQKLNLKCLNN